MLDGLHKLHLYLALDKHQIQVLEIFCIILFNKNIISIFLFVVLTVLVSDDQEKREKLGKEYNLKTYTYDQFSQALAEGHCDAFYIATPNNRHREFAAPALEKGYNEIILYHFLLIELIIYDRLSCFT